MSVESELDGLFLSIIDCPTWPHINSDMNERAISGGRTSQSDVIIYSQNKIVVVVASFVHWGNKFAIITRVTSATGSNWFVPRVIRSRRLR